MDNRILVIDFDPVSAELTGALLATRGLPFTLARSRKELEAALASGLPAIVVLDPALPDEKEGLRLCSQLVERLGPRGSVPILLASRTLRGARWKSLARDSGAELFLERPSDDRLLLAAAERAVGAARAATPPAGPPPPGSAVRPAGAITTARTRHAPTPAENELESMVDEMFAQWFVEAEASGAPRPSTSGGTLSAAATRAPAGAAAVLEPPVQVVSAPPAPPIARPAQARPEAPARLAAAGPATESRPSRVSLGQQTGPTGPASAPVPSAVPPGPAPALTVREEAPAAPRSTGLPRLVAVGAAIALIGLGIGFVVLQWSGREAGSPNEVPDARRPALAQPVLSSPDGDGTIAARESDPTAVETAPSTPAPAPSEAPPRPAPAKAAPPPSANDPLAEKKVPSMVPPSAVPSSVEPAVPAPAATVLAAPAEVQKVPEPEFVPSISPGVLPESLDPESDATLARLTAPQLIGSSRVAPVFPAVARQMRMSGQVKLRVQVRADGRVGQVSVLSEPTPNVGFGKAAEAAVRHWRYRPATLGSRAVDTEIDVVVNFSSD